MDGWGVGQMPPCSLSAGAHKWEWVWASSVLPVERRRIIGY